MDYKNHYNALILKANSRTEKLEIIEKHHIVPRCMGGTNDSLNIAVLSPEEHFVAHQLLVKIYPGNKKIFAALHKMCVSSSKNPRNNKWYGWIRKRYIESVSGENNPSAKFTNAQVLEIYHSNEDLDILSARYNVSRYNIITIKRKIYYTSVTRDITSLPGFSEKQGSTPFPIPINLIPDIFYDTGDYAYFWEKYRASEKVVRGIKSKKSFKKITTNLGAPGQLKRYGMTQSMVDQVYNAAGTNIDIANRFGIHYNTARNIKSKYSRAFNMWEEF